MKIKKYKVSIIVLLIVIINIPLNIFAHSGRTDGSGGHYVGGTGEYHYHHGYSAHQHIDGVCPYEYDDKTSSTSSTSEKKDDTEKEDSFDNSKEKVTTTKKENNVFKNILGIFIAFWWLIIPFGCGVVQSIKEKIQKEKKPNNNIEDNKQEEIKKENNNTAVNRSTNKYICPRCGGQLIIKKGRYGSFVGCKNYPMCKYTRNIKK